MDITVAVSAETAFVDAIAVLNAVTTIDWMTAAGGLAAGIGAVGALIAAVIAARRVGRQIRQGEKQHLEQLHALVRPMMTVVTVTQWGPDRMQMIVLNAGAGPAVDPLYGAWIFPTATEPTQRADFTDALAVHLGGGPFAYDTPAHYTGSSGAMPATGSRESVGLYANTKRQTGTAGAYCAIAIHYADTFGNTFEDERRILYYSTAAKSFL